MFQRKQQYSSPMLHCLVAVLLAAYLPLSRAEGVTATLSVQTLVAQPDGRLQAVPAVQAKPGDLLQYSVRYRNTSAQPARQVEATLPIPPGMVYDMVPGERAAPLASLDGRQFMATPLTRVVRQADGKQRREPVPLDEYRHVRWRLGDLAPGQEVTVSAKARVSGAERTTDRGKP